MPSAEPLSPMSLLETAKALELYLHHPSADSLRRLFGEELGWNIAPPVPNSPYEPIAELGGVRVFLCVLQSNRLPSLTERRKLYEDLFRTYGEHLLVYQTADARQLAFVWARRLPTQKIEFRTLPYEVHLPARTTLEQLSELAFPLNAPEPSLTELLTRLDRAFDVEAVTQRFFQEFKRRFEAVETTLQACLPSKAERALFTLKLFNRLLFIRFLERKGWLRFQNRTDYLRALWQDYQTQRTHESNFYRDRLKPLFFSGLNNPQGRNLSAVNQGGLLGDLIGEVPYLNGGLFEKDARANDDTIFVPDEAIEPLLKDLFYRFNFTITESTPLDVEVAVDPEMLGKVFEELVTGRHESGAYYTPRPVVAFMCQEALIGYLQSQCPSKIADAIQQFVNERDPSHLKDPEAVLDALKRIRVCDPACGSGAYLLGMLQELLELRSALFQAHHIDAETVYQRKLEIIENNLYGVDIDPFAVEIARLRLWLSLVVEDTRNPLDDPSVNVALPNLDFKIEVGDSLLAPDPQGGAQPDMFRLQQIEEYDRLKDEYLRTHDGNRKQELRNKIEKLRQEIYQWTHGDSQVQGFDWRVEFAEVFANGGFDVVLANPPYVRQELIGDTKAHLLKQYNAVAVGRSDLYVYFYARGLQLLKEGGWHIFICSNSWLDVGFGAKLQEYLLNNAHIVAIYDSALERQFASADVNTIISILRKGKPSGEAETHFIRLNAPFEEAIANPAHQRVITKTRAELWQAGLDEEGRYAGDKWGGKYLRAPDIFYTILEKGKGKLVRLGEVAEVRRGFTTGANEFFYLEPVRSTGAQATILVRNGAGWEGEIVRAWLRPVVKSPREIRTLRVRLEDLRYLVLLPPDDVRQVIETNPRQVDTYIQTHYPKAYEYIKWGERQGYHTGSTCKARPRWWDLGNWEPPNILWADAYNTKYIAPLLGNGVYGDKRFFYVNPRDHDAVFALLNSTLVPLFIEVEGVSNLGEGVIYTNVYWLKSLGILSADYLSSPSRARLLDAFERLAQREVKSIFEELGLPKPNKDYSNIRPEDVSLDKVLPDRRALDEVVFEVLGLTEEEQLAVYRAVVELVKNRLVKAKSV